jgi:hypothetical protein
MIALLTGLFNFANNYSTEKWKVTDLNFSTAKNIENPLDIQFGAIFRNENGQTMNIPGFWNDGKEWIIRIAPSIEGIWTYTTYSSINSLAGKTGQLIVLSNQKINKHGSVVVSESKKQRLSYEDGKPYFPLAYEIDWLFALDAENKSDIPRTKQIVKVLSENKFNMAIMNIYAYDASWGEREKIDPKYNFSKPKIFPFGGNNETPNHSTLNIDFFKHFDRVMNCLNENEIVSHLMIYVWNKKVNWPKPGSEEDNRYFDYVVKRYQAYPNLIWDISKEALAYGMDDMDYIIDRIERLKKIDGHQRFVTVHDYKFCNEYPDLVDIISVQEWRPNLYNEMRQIAEKYPSKPIFNVEHGGYEQTMHQIFHGAYINSEVCLERSYVCLFAGTYTTYYWQNSSWYEVVYDPFGLEKEKQPKFIYYKHLMDFFKQYNYSELVPQQYFYSPFCLTNNQDTWIYLITAGMYAIEGMPPKEMRGNSVEVQWFNPLTGEYSETEIKKLGSWTGIKKPEVISSPFSLAIIKKTK